MICNTSLPDKRATDECLVEALPESYERWRRSRLGRITDALEERLILDLLGPVDGLDVLDLGCGDGDMASRFERLGARVTGLDADPRMLTAARRRAEIESMEFALVLGRVEALPFPDASFDRVVAVTVLCFVRDVDRAIAEMARVLKPGGTLLVANLTGFSSARARDGWQRDLLGRPKYFAMDRYLEARAKWEEDTNFLDGSSGDDDLYDANHARYVLQMSPVLEDGAMKLISFDKFFYDKADHQMKAMDEKRPDDFISISGSKMRALARQGATPCSDPIPSDLHAANCVPQGFMVQSGWDIVCDYYQHVDTGAWVPWSRRMTTPEIAPSVLAEGVYGTDKYALFLQDGGKQISPWHDIPLYPSGGGKERADLGRAQQPHA